MGNQSHYYRNRLQILEDRRIKYEENVIEERIRGCFNYDRYKLKLLEKIECNKCGKSICKPCLVKHQKSRNCKLK